MARAHVRSLWTGWGALAPLPLALWPLSMAFLRGPRWDYLAFSLAVVILAYGNAWTKRFFVTLYPLALVALVYDAMNLVRDVCVTPERLHICDLRALDMMLVRVDVNGVPGTVHDWLQPHATLALDLLCALPYGTFIFATLAFATYLYTRDRGALQRFGWTFLLVNVAGFVTYHLYPAAPPWYFHTHGCAVDLATRASEGPNLARLDAWLGTSYFKALFGRSSDVFGSVPSLHVAYPMMTLLGGWRVYGAVARSLTVVFVGLMCFAAVYLDHHWIIDVILGIAYAYVGTWIVGQVSARWRAMR